MLHVFKITQQKLPFVVSSRMVHEMGWKWKEWKEAGICGPIISLWLILWRYCRRLLLKAWSLEWHHINWQIPLKFTPNGITDDKPSFNAIMTQLVDIRVPTFPANIPDFMKRKKKNFTKVPQVFSFCCINYLKCENSSSNFKYVGLIKIILAIHKLENGMHYPRPHGK